MTTAALDSTERAAASDHDAGGRELRDRGHQLRAARRRSRGPRLEPAFARSGCRCHGRRAVEESLSQLRLGVYDTAAQASIRLSCLANGETKAISEVEVGDYVLATDPLTGEASSRTVTDTHVMLHDDDLLDLTIEDDDGRGVIQTTDNHQFWSATDQEWEAAIDLSVGEELRQDDGTAALVVGVVQRPGRQHMWDLTVEVDHNFSVNFGNGAVLVHNQDGFENLHPEDVGRPFQRVSAAQAMERSGRYVYVVTMDGRLVIARAGRAGHVDLAAGERVRAAGEFRTSGRTVTEINNASGHFKPSGAQAQDDALGCVWSGRDEGFRELR